MGYDEAAGYCDQCRRGRLIRRKETNHLLHLFLTLFTLGLWVVIWVLSSIKFGGWRCSQCGGEVQRDAFR